jgi:hypothetical protein
MTTQCPICGSADLRRVAPGAIFDDYLCKENGHRFELLSPTVKRVGIFSALSVLTLGLDGGALATIVTSALGGGDSDSG